MPQTDPYASAQTQQFEVVLVKDGVNPLAAKADDFKRVPAAASSPTGAMESDAVAAVAKTGFKPLQAVVPGMLTDYEMGARRREHEAALGGPLDRSKI